MQIVCQFNNLLNNADSINFEIVWSCEIWQIFLIWIIVVQILHYRPFIASQTDCKRKTVYLAPNLMQLLKKHIYYLGPY